MWRVYHWRFRRAMMNSDHANCCFVRELPGHFISSVRALLRIRLASLRGLIIEMLVETLMLLMQAIVTIGSSPAMCGSQMCLARTFGMDRAA
jgi:hypothetical protein